MPRASSGLPTPREVHALRLLANGHTLTSAARVLGIGRAGVASLLVDAYRRLGVHDRAHAVAVALRLGLIGLDEVRLPEGLYAAVRPANGSGVPECHPAVFGAPSDASSAGKGHLQPPTPRASAETPSDGPRGGLLRPRNPQRPREGP